MQLGLTGWPLGHSLSPQIHAAALNALGLPGSYRLLPVPPLPEGAGELQATLSRVRQGELQGLNVTIPHKQAVIPWLDELSAAAQAIGAVNVIYPQGDRLAGDNSDAPAFLADLERFLSTSPDYLDKKEPRQALVIGAGGSARAVVYALLHGGWRVSLAARRVEAAERLAGDLSLSCPQALPIEPFSLDRATLESRMSCDLIVNSTPLGMHPHPGASPWPAGLPFPTGAAIYDLVYNPPETALVRAARQAGRPATTGLGMLAEQAALAFECWTGLSAPRQAMLAAAESALGLPGQRQAGAGPRPPDELDKEKI